MSRDNWPSETENLTDLEADSLGCAAFVCNRVPLRSMLRRVHLYSDLVGLFAEREIMARSAWADGLLPYPDQLAERSNFPESSRNVLQITLFENNGRFSLEPR